MKRHDFVVQVPRLDPKDLYDRRSQRDHARLRAYNQLLEQIYHRIYSSSQLSGSTSSILYTVPPFLLGLPKIDMEDCILYLVYQLRSSGYEVRFTWPNLLWISWKHHELEYLTKKNPIIQAMTPEPPPAPPTSAGANGASRGGSQKKKQLLGPGAEYGTGALGSMQANPQVTFADEIGIINGIQPSTYSRFGQQPATPRRAADYQPPASFMNAMERPLPPSKSAVAPLRQITSSKASSSDQFSPPSYASQQPQREKERTVLDDLWGGM